MKERKLSEKSKAKYEAAGMSKGKMSKDGKKKYEALMKEMQLGGKKKTGKK